jgi:predicted double-glycine peptidase
MLVVCLLIAGDRSRFAKNEPETYHQIPEGAIKVPLPDVQQPDDYSCGAAALMAICSYYGVGREELDEMKTELHTTSRGGTDYRNLVKYAKQLGFEVELVKDDMSRAALEKALDAGKPVICSIQAYGSPEDYEVAPADRLKPRNNRNGHYVVAIGYQDDTFFFMDPSLTGRRGFLSWAELDKRWHENEGTTRDPDVHSHLGIVIGPKNHKPVYPVRARKIE